MLLNGLLVTGVLELSSTSDVASERLSMPAAIAEAVCASALPELGALDTELPLTSAARAALMIACCEGVNGKFIVK